MGQAQKTQGGQRCSVSLALKPGDYTKSDIHDESLVKLFSLDVCEIESVTDNFAKFYVVIKSYFEEREGLYRILDGKDNIESSMIATKMSVMTIISTAQIMSLESDTDIPEEIVNGMKEMISDLNKYLSSRKEMVKFDKQMTSHYGVVSAEAGSEPAGIDNHIQAKA